MTELALLLLLAAIGHGLSRWTGAPAIPLLLGLGMCLSFSGLVDHSTTGLGEGDESLFLFLELGLTVLVFSSGVELNPQRFRRQKSSVIWVGLMQFFIMGLAGWSGARLLGYSGVETMYLAFAVSASSTIVVLRQLQVSQQSFEPHGRMVVGVLLLQDALTILALVAFTLHDKGLPHLAKGYGWAMLMAVTAWLLQWRGARWLIERCKGDEESMLLTVLSVLFIFLGAAGLGGLPLVAGAFLAGYSLSSFPVSGLVGSLLQSLTDFFRAVFFVALGALVMVPDVGAVGSALLLSLLVLVITPPLVALMAEWKGLTGRSAIESGLLLAQTSEYSLILGLLGLRLGQIGPAVFSVVAMMAVITMTATPFLARDAVARRLMRLHPSRRKRLPALDCHDHVLVLGLGSAGMWVLRPLQAAGVPLLVVDDDPIVIAELDKKGIPCLRGDGSDEHTLERIGARHSRLIIASMRRVSDAQKVLSHVRGSVPVLARAFEDYEAAIIEKHGGIPISNSEAAVEQFIKWFEAGAKPT